MWGSLQRSQCRGQKGERASPHAARTDRHEMLRFYTSPVVVALLPVVRRHHDADQAVHHLLLPPSHRRARTQVGPPAAPWPSLSSAAPSSSSPASSSAGPSATSGTSTARPAPASRTASSSPWPCCSAPSTSFTDFTFALVPAWILSHLKMRRKTKWALCLLMGTGLHVSALLWERFGAYLGGPNVTNSASTAVLPGSLVLARRRRPLSVEQERPARPPSNRLVAWTRSHPRCHPRPARQPKRRRIREVLHSGASLTPGDATNARHGLGGYSHVLRWGATRDMEQGIGGRSRLDGFPPPAAAPTHTRPRVELTARMPLACLHPAPRTGCG